MTTAEMVTKVKTRTKQADDTKVITELQSAYDWARNRVFNTENGPDILSTFDEELTLAARTRNYNLAANLANSILGIKQLWLKLTTDTVFTPMIPADTNRTEYVRNDSETAADTTVIATGHPVYYDVINYNQVRFAPALPSGAVIRVDYYRIAPLPDPTANPTLDAGNDLPEVFHEAIVNKATAQVFENLDDSRAGTWELRAESTLRDAMYVTQRRVQGPILTTPFRARRRRVV